MSQYVAPGRTFETGNGVQTNTVGQPIYVCDCCYNRRHYVTRAAADAHEMSNSPAPHNPHGPGGTYNEIV